ncbi:response regulator [Dokdonella soli]|uniref:Response regulator n=1 Tax=Dokdonella soli TaxID=529810 RepID=A0ABN1IYQ6_9GAMM
MHVLIVEDDPSLGRGIQTALARWTWTSEWAMDGAAALAMAKSGHFDVILLDLGLPKIDGLEVLRLLRQGGSTTPVLVLTARDTLAARVTGLDSGADDYLIKPFELDELAARLRALHRRTHGSASALLEVDALAIDTVSHQATWEGRPLELSRLEFLLLRTLAERAGRVVTREFLEQALYGSEGVESNALEVHVHSLRRKLQPDAIKTARGLGYLLVRKASP